MKLYLTSYRVPVPGKLFALIGKPPEAVKIAIIPNAKDAYISRIWHMRTNEVVSYFSQLGISTCNIIDLRSYNNVADLKDALSSYDLIWVNGGNTFMLRHEMRRSGFDTIIRELLDRGIVYGGESAGELVAGPTLRGIESADKPEFAEEIIWGGLGLVDEFIFPHADEVAYVETLAVAKKIHPGLIELKNSQAFVVDGDEREIIEGEQ